MFFARTRLWLMGVVLAAGASTAVAQVGPNESITPFGPSNVRYDLELFKPPDVSAYADWPRPNEGMFFQYERLFWAIQQPTRTDIGLANGVAVGLVNGVINFDPTNQPIGNILTAYRNSLDTGFLRADQTWGNRFELGFVEDNKGWLFSMMNLQDQIQNAFFGGDLNTPTLTPPGGIFIVFRDPRNLLLGFVDTNGDGFDDDLNVTGVPGIYNRVPGVFGRPTGPGNANLDINNDGIPDAFAGFTDFGDQVPLVPIFNEVFVRNATSLNSIEVSRTWRYPPTHIGGIWQLNVGVRWILYRDRFDVTAINDTPDDTTGSTPPGLPGTSFWDSVVDNNLFGPQIGLRYDHTAARWDLSGEVRFLAACNFQSIHLNGELASALDPIPGNLGGNGPNGLALAPINVPFNMVRTSFSSWRYDETFAPVGEIRATVAYKLTQAISVQAGYNAMIGGGISRASRRIDYVLPALQILNANKNDAWFIDGVSLGLNCNR
jgi:hypothetical protein